MSGPRELPQVSVLSYWQYKGWDCVWCGKRLSKGAVSAGIAQGDNGAHSLDTEVFACPEHPDGQVPTAETENTRA